MSALSTPQPARHPAPTARAVGLSHLIFERPDLDAAERFLTDFGLTVAERAEDRLLLRASGPSAWCYRVERGPQARFVGVGLAVGSQEELAALAALPGASPVAPSTERGGGAVVTLTDPAGFTVEAVHGRTEAAALPTRAPLPANLGDTRQRVNDPQRPPAAPPEIIKLGHLALEVVDFQATCAWYTRHFGFVPSDVQVFPDGSPGVVFLRLDRSDEPADHHTLAIAQSVLDAYGHSAFEVVDLDAVGMGQRVLQQRGWTHAWGIGRHLLGSQIFDYWQDAWGAKHEHYCDGDVFTAEVPMGVHPLSADAMAQWGPPLPASFTRPKLSALTLKAAADNVRRSPDLSIDKLLMLARIFI